MWEDMEEVILWVMDLSWNFSFHWLKVRFSAGVRNSSSHPSVVRFWRGGEWNVWDELLFARDIFYGFLFCILVFLLEFGIGLTQINNVGCQ